MHKTGKKRPLGECLGENSAENQNKRHRYENVVLLRGRRRRRNHNNNTSETPPQRITRTGESSSTQSLGGHVTAGKRKKPGDEQPVIPTTTEEQSADENDIISELTKQFKKARLRPVFFTISTFVEQNVDEVGFTMADEPEAEVTFRFSLPMKTARHHEVENNAEVSEEATLTLSQTAVSGGSEDTNYGVTATDIGANYTATSSVFVFKAAKRDDEEEEDDGRKFKKMKTSQE